MFLSGDGPHDGLIIHVSLGLLIPEFDAFVFHLNKIMWPWVDVILSDIL